MILFAGGWSDRTGRRKPCMLLPLIGELAALIGEFNVFNLFCYCYLSDFKFVLSEKNVLFSDMALLNNSYTVSDLVKNL